MIAGQRWPTPGRAGGLGLAGLGLAALLSAALHGSAVFALLFWLKREPPAEPVADRGVEILWDEAATEAVSMAQEAGAPRTAPGVQAPEMTEAAEAPAPPPPPPPAPPAPQVAATPPPPRTIPPPPAPPRLDLPPTELRTPDLAVAPPPPMPEPNPEPVEEIRQAEAPPPAERLPPTPTPPLASQVPEPPLPEAQPPDATPPLPLPPPAPSEPPRQTARARPTPARPPAPEGARPGPDAAQQAGAGIGRATGAVVPPGLDALHQNTAPPYPEAARLRGEQGSVALELSVGTDGRVITVGITRSSGSPMLDAAARQTVAGWRFRPATRDGEPVTGTIRTTIHFRLQ